MRICASACAIGLFLAATYAIAEATDKYVDCTNGLDSNSGSVGSKWKTISHAAVSVAAGGRRACFERTVQ